MSSPSLVIGVDIGGTKIDAALVSLATEEVLFSKRIATPPTRDAVVNAVLDLVQLIRKRGGTGVEAVGVGFPGLVHDRDGIVQDSPILPEFAGYPLASKLEKAVALPCVVDNDATATGIGEFRALGCPSGLHMILLTIGTGIGGAIMVDGQIYRGRTNSSAEFGNTTIDWQGDRCVSGNRGSLNTIASGTALLRRAHRSVADERNGDSVLHRATTEITGAALQEAFEADDALATRLVEDSARALGVGIANFVNIFDPDLVVLSGGLCRFGPRYMDFVRHECFSRAFPIHASHVDLRFATRGHEAGVYGAACLVGGRSRTAES